METRPTIICLSISASDLKEFDRKVSAELNHMRWYRFTYKVTFQQDRYTFYAHIIFTEREDTSHWLTKYK